MPDEILSQLCSICHAAPYKYKCPGCGARNCSLICIQKHKVRTECSGRHNPTDFVPREILLTPAGVDHDYNFISAIDRAAPWAFILVWCCMAYTAELAEDLVRHLCDLFCTSIRASAQHDSRWRKFKSMRLVLLTLEILPIVSLS